MESTLCICHIDRVTRDDSTHAFGTELRAKRERAGLAIRRAAAAAGISEGRWRQLERGYQKAGGVEIDVNPKATTVAAVARAVGWAVPEAMASAGFDPGTELPDEAGSDVVDLACWHLLSGPQRVAVRQLVRTMAYPGEDSGSEAATVTELGGGSATAQSEQASVHELSQGQRQRQT